MEAPQNEKQRLLELLDTYRGQVKEKTLDQLLEILGSETLYLQLTPEDIDHISDYKTINIGEKTYFGPVWGGKKAASILRIASLLGEDGRQTVHAVLKDVKDSLEEAKRLAEKFPKAE